MSKLEKLDWEDGGPPDWDLSSDEILRRAQLLRQQRPITDCVRGGRGPGRPKTADFSQVQNGMVIGLGLPSIPGLR